MLEEDQYFQEAKFKRKLHKYENAINNGESLYMEAEDLTDIAEFYMTQEKEDSANKAIQLALDLHPNNIDAQVFIARQEMFHGNIKNASQICDAIIDQEDREVIFLRAEILIQRGKTEDAAALLQDTYNNLSEDKANFIYDSACIFIDHNELDYAMRLAKFLCKSHPKHPKINHLLAEILILENKHEEAIPKLIAILDEQPYNTNIWIKLAESQNEAGQFYEALDSLAYVLAIDPKNKNALITEAASYFHLNQLEIAHNIYEDIIKEHPQDGYTYYLNAVCLTNLEKYEKAAENLKLAQDYIVKGTQESIHVFLHSAYVEGKLHHLQNALDALEIAEKIGQELNFEICMFKGGIFLENNLKAEAEEQFKQAINLTENYQETLLAIAIAYGEAMYFEDSCNILNRILELDPKKDGKIAIPYLAYCYYNLGDNENFLKYLREAPTVNKEITEFLFGKHFPNIQPSEYYLYAFQNIYGRFPEEWE